MENRKLLNAIISFGAIIALAVVARLIPHAPNFAPIGALALFTGYHFKNKLVWALPVAAMILSDFVLGFHSTVPFVYGSFIIISIIGSYLKKDKTSLLFGASFSSSVIFFLVTNFGVWMMDSIYAKNMSGLVDSYMMGLPFFRNTLVSDLLYTFSFFYGYRYIAGLVRVKLAFFKSS